MSKLTKSGAPTNNVHLTKHKSSREVYSKWYVKLQITIAMLVETKSCYRLICYIYERPCYIIYKIYHRRYIIKDIL